MNNNINNNSENKEQDNSTLSNNNLSSSNDKKAFPKLRFKGFDEPWMKCKLSDFATKINKKNSNMQCVDILTNSAEYGIVYQIDFFDKKILHSDNIENYYIVKQDDFIYNPRISNLAPVGPINRNKLNCIGIISPLYLAFNVNNIDCTFLEWYYKTSKWHDFMRFFGDSGARHDRFSIKSSIFFNMPIPYTSNSEQIKIGIFFNKINKIINLHQKLLDNLKKYKKGLIEYILEKYGTNNVRLKDVLIEVNEKSKINNEYDIISSTKNGLFLQKEYFNKNAASKNNIGYKILKKNQIVLSPQNLWMGNINYNQEFDIGIVSPSYIIYEINTKYNPYFIGIILKSNNALKQYMLSSEQGASIVRRNLNIELFRNINLKIPNRQLQDNIANNIKKIETKIFHQEKILNNILKIKKGLLNQMFI